MKKYHIALAGTFDVENYGDLMFPVIFERAMRKRGLKFELTLFSPSESAEEALDSSRMVYSFRDFDELDEKYHFDALVVGGGALIHFRDFAVRMPGKDGKEEYHNIHSWLSLMYLASRNNIKILFNLPQIPFEIPKELRPLFKVAIDQVDYLAVRDEFSSRYIQDVFGNKKIKINVYPDTVSLVDELFDKDTLIKSGRKLLGFEDKYMVFHFQFTDGINGELFAELDKVVNDAERRGVRVVLLPIGYTHGDEGVMKSYLKHNSEKCFMLKRKMNIAEMTAILAGAEYYVGMSFHGSLVTVAFDGKVFTVNPSLKNQELYRKYGIEDCIARSYDDLLNVVGVTLSRGSSYRKRHQYFKKLVNEHFDNIYKKIIDGKIKPKTPGLFLDEICLVIPKLESLSRKIKEVYTESRSVVAKCNNEAAKMKCTIIKQSNEIEKLSYDLRTIENSTAFKLGRKITFVPHLVKSRLKKRF